MKPCAEFSSVALPAIARHLLMRALPHAVLFILSLLIVASVFMENMPADEKQQEPKQRGGVSQVSEMAQWGCSLWCHP